MEYPYFKGLEADRYSFYRVPKALVKADPFQKMSGDAKLLYAVLLDRMSLSIKNGWQDKHGNAYIICTIEEVMDSIHCARQKAVKLLDELEQEFQLIERRRQGLGKPNLLYVKDLYAGLSQSNYWKYENHTSGSLKNELPGVLKSNGSNTEKINKTDNSETDLIYPAELQEEEQYRRYFKEALAWRRKQGAGFRLTSSVPFGYIRRNGESNMIKDEEVAPYLSESFSRYASGQKMRDIAKWLNEQGVEPPMRHKKRILGKSYDAESDQWTTDMLRCLFRNPTYTGAAANGSHQIIAENCHEPYITKEQFYAFPCNMREGENKISIRKSYKKPNPLAKHIVCTCGYALCWHKDKRTGEELFYCRYCRAHKENGKNLKVPAATIYKKVMDALELEHLEEEKLAAAIQQGAGKKAIEVVRAEKSLQMKSVLAELNMEQFRRVPLYESYIADEITEEQYRSELLDYEEAHRKLNEQLTTIMEDTLVWERALSLRNPWIQQMAQYKTSEELDRNFVKKYIEQVTVTLLDDGQAEISLTMKTDEWKQMLSRIEVEGTDSGTKE